MLWCLESEVPLRAEEHVQQREMQVRLQVLFRCMPSAQDAELMGISPSGWWTHADNVIAQSSILWVPTNDARR